MQRSRARSDWIIGHSARRKCTAELQDGVQSHGNKGNSMKKNPRVPKFRRATPAVRREALIDATLRCLKKYGHGGGSVRRISAAAGVSIGLINHHFPSKAGLIAETYETLALQLQDELRSRAHNHAASPRERLSDFFR